ncbi:MAG: hypothetical protein ACYCW6_15040 [Candidatus Xenobia bacterium]
MDDELLRYFGGDRMKKMFDWLGVKKGETITDQKGGITWPWSVDGAIERAQKKVEALHFDQRENTTRYDGVLNIQRNIIYGERRKIMEGCDLKPSLVGWADAQVDDITRDYKTHHGKYSRDDVAAMTDRVKESFGLPDELNPVGFDQDKVDADQFKLELRSLVRASLYAREMAVGPDAMKEFEKQATLDAIDDEWHYHLENMSDLQNGIGWVALAQKDPWVEYQLQGHELYEQMRQRVIDRVLDSVFKTPLEAPAPPPPMGNAQLPPGIASWPPNWAPPGPQLDHLLQMQPPPQPAPVPVGAQTGGDGAGLNGLVR